MLSNKSIAIIICWYGPYPWYFPYFIHSCSYNSTVDFFIITDNLATIDNKPQNVKILYTTLEEIKTTASEKLDFTVNIDYPYKLCDFKPAYGLIFEDYTKGYDFWALSDIDIIYGNLRDFFTDEILCKNDYVSVRHDYTTGCFSVFRNNSLMNNFFKRSTDYKKVFTTRAYMGFDELNFKHCELNEGKMLYEIETEIECFTHLVKRAEQCNEIQAHFDFILIEGVPGKIKFNNGQLIYSRKYEAALYHLYWFKNVYQPKKIPKKIPNTFYISPTRIYFRNMN